jgi:hypothetical protein
VTRRASKPLLVAGFLLGAGGACTLLNPLDAYGPPHAKPLEGGSSSNPNTTPDGGCALARWPDRPAHDDGPDALSLTFAASSFTVGADPTSAPIGFDLDGVCTCPGPPSCVSPSSVKSACDSDGGIDNGGSQMLDRFLTLSGSKDRITTAIQQGQGGFLMVLADYNGLANDTKVSVSLYASNGTQSDPPGGSSPPPRHDGTDVWTIESSSLYGGASGPPFISKVADADAYVANGVFVAQMDLRLPLGDLVFDLRSAVVTGTLKHQGNAWQITNGVLDGRWPVAEFLTSFDTLKDPFGSSGEGLCGSSPLYANIKGDVCQVVDIVQDPKKDNTGAKCDSIGLAVTFSGEQAVMGVIDDPKPAKHYCGDNWQDDCPP